MNPDHVELVRRGLAAANDGDYDTVLGLLAEDVEVYSDPSTGNPGSFRGKDGYLAWAGQWLDVWDSFQMEIRELSPVGEDGILVTVDQVGKGKGSGIEIGVTGVVYFFRIRDGLTTRIALYMNREAAEEDLGLR